MADVHATPWRNVAKVVKPQGIKGEVVVVAIHGLPFVLHEGMEVVLTPPNLRGPRSWRIERIRELSSGFGITFAGAKTLDDALKLVGKTVLAARADVDEGIEEQGEFFDAVGLAVVDVEHGELGEVVDVYETLAHDIWVVEGPHGEVLIPVVDEFVLGLSEDDEGCVEVKIPRGLIGLNEPAAKPEGEDGA